MHQQGFGKQGDKSILMCRGRRLFCGRSRPATAVLPIGRSAAPAVRAGRGRQDYRVRFGGMARPVSVAFRGIDAGRVPSGDVVPLPGRRCRRGNDLPRRGAIDGRALVRTANRAVPRRGSCPAGAGRCRFRGRGGRYRPPGQGTVRRPNGERPGPNSRGH